MQSLTAQQRPVRAQVPHGLLLRHHQARGIRVCQSVSLSIGCLNYRADRPLERQVTPFYIWTADNERLFAWHVLPVGLYAQHEHELVEEPAGLRENITSTKAFRLLKSDAKSLLVVNCEILPVHSTSPFTC